MNNTRLFALRKCVRCQQIELPRQTPSKLGRDQCPVCWDPLSTPWPALESEAILRDVADLDPSDEGYPRVATVFLCTGLEVNLLAWQDLLYEEGAHLVEALLEAHRGYSRLLRLYRPLGYGSFRSDSEAAGFGEFPGRWARFQNTRNLVVHRGKEATAVTPEVIQRMLQDAVVLFAHFHNRNNVESLTYRIATDGRVPPETPPS